MINCQKTEEIADRLYIEDAIKLLRSRGYTVLHPDLKTPKEVTDSWRGEVDRQGGSFSAQEIIDAQENWR